MFSCAAVVVCVVCHSSGRERTTVVRDRVGANEAAALIEPAIMSSSYQLSTYLESYLDSISTLPFELKRNFTLMRELDSRAEGASAADHTTGRALRLNCDREPLIHVQRAFIYRCIGCRGTHLECREDEEDRKQCKPTLETGEKGATGAGTR